MRGIELAPFVEVRDGIALHVCIGGCGRLMQPDNRSTPLRDVPRHGARGRCTACTQAESRGGRTDGPRSIRRRPAHEALDQAIAAALTWARDAACGRTKRHNDFHVPERHRGTEPTPAAVEAARTFCAHCPVVDACDAFAEAAAETSDPVSGLWGGQWRVGTTVTPIRMRSAA